jgi:cellulose synthase/poly-beta-1,6-N-acetylglucosamine synthase-like glycosyltransferase
MEIVLTSGYILFGIYIVTLVYITIFCLLQLHLLYKYLKGNRKPNIPHHKEEDVYPMVTIQLPVYNEKYVIERLIDNIVRLDYPKTKMEIQILDDSTDDTVEITKRKVEEYRNQGFDIQCIARTNRTGFKAGALKEAMSKAKGEFIAIFDADFLPRPDFLKKTMPAFDDPKTGVVQTRWEHINQNHSILTELQAFQLNVHFTIEQKGRYNADYFLQFNGTAGIWRKSCIEDAGGWEADTLTEDLDLSYRAQLKNWKIKFLEDVTAPAELPAEINGLKSQQFRWMKGGAETAKKLLPLIWSSKISSVRKIQATSHLLSSSIFIFVFILGVFSVPLMFFIKPLGIEMEKLTMFMVSFMSVMVVYFIANVSIAWPKQNKVWMVLKFIFLFPVFLSLSMGLAFHNSLAVIEGFLGKKSAFIRTPKFGITKKGESVSKGQYFNAKIDWVSVGEGALSLYFIGAILIGWNYGHKDFFVLHGMLAIGYLTLFYYAIEGKFSKN